MAADSIKNQSANDRQAAVCREVGLDLYEGNEEIYRNVLMNFAKCKKNTLIELKDAICAGNLKLAYRTAHSLRGAAGTIGAGRLADAAMGVESALASISGVGQDFNGEKVFNGQMMILEREFTGVFHELKSLVIEKEEICSRPIVMDREKMIELFDQLAPYLETGDTKCLEYLDSIEDILRSAAEGFLLFITQMEHYDFDQAYETMEKIRRFIRS